MQDINLDFLYDHKGLSAVEHSDSTCFCKMTAQNDIVALLDNSGNVVVKYKYDAWGKCQTTVVTSTANTIANLNPFRYRSYYFDTETGLYFLKTRYYDPVIGRFMTIDDIRYLDPESINGLNLYAYCLNNPIMYSDLDGCLPKWLTWMRISVLAFSIIAICIVSFGSATPVLIAAGIGLIIGMSASAIGQYIDNGYSWQGFSIEMMIYDGIVGAVNGAIAATGITTGMSILVGAIIGGASSAGSDLLFNNGNIQWDNLVVSIAIGLCAGMISGSGAQRHITGLTHGQKILSNTIKNRTFRAISNQMHIRNLHLYNVIISAGRYFLGNFYSGIISKGDF